MENDLDNIVRRILKQVCTWDDRVAVERQAAVPLLAEFETLAVPERWRRLREDARCRTHTFARLLGEHSRRMALRHPAEAMTWAEYGLEAAQRLRSADYDSELIEDLRAQSWGLLANACRVAGEVTAADAPIRHARAHLAAGSGLPAARAEVLTLEATVRLDQRRLDEAEELFAECLCLRRELGDRHGEGRILVSMANLQRERGELEETVSLLDQALKLIEREREPRLELCARHNLADSLVDLGRYQESADLLPEVRGLAETVGEDLDRLRLRWLEGRVAIGLGALETAERQLRDTRDEFMRRDMYYDVGLLSLEIGLLLITEGRLQELRELASETVEIFQARQIQREATGAMLLFARAAATEEVTRELLQHLVGRVQKARLQSMGVRSGKVAALGAELRGAAAEADLELP